MVESHAVTADSIHLQRVPQIRDGNASGLVALFNVTAERGVVATVTYLGHKAYAPGAAIRQALCTRDPHTQPRC